MSRATQRNLTDAELHFREALEHDLYYAPAHNNLGLALLQTGRCYEAAWEFEYAAKLAPYSPEPRANLGLLYENTGRTDRAVSEYDSALAIDPSHVTAMRHLARVYVKTGHTGPRLKTVLEKLFQSPGDVEWDRWVRSQLIRLGRAEKSDEPFELNGQR